MAEYAYVRVSTKEQRLDRQLAALPASIPLENIFKEKESGKNFEDRPVWNRMMGILREGDILFIKSIDRMGRNYREMGEVWRELTQRMGVHVVVLDMPILDTRGQNQLFQVLIADIVFALFSYVADNERTTIKARQREGIEAAKKRGVQFGPKFTVTPQQEASFIVWSHGIKSPREWARELGMRDSTWRLRLRMWLEDPEKVRRNREPLPDYEEHMEAFKEQYGLGGAERGPRLYGDQKQKEVDQERFEEIAGQIDRSWLLDAKSDQELQRRQRTYFPLVTQMRECGASWAMIADVLCDVPGHLGSRYRKWRKTHADSDD